MNKIAAKKSRFKFIMIFILSLLSACMDSRQGNYYQSYINPTITPNFIALSEGQEPQLIKSDNIEIDKEQYEKKGFLIIGKSEFETTDEKKFLRRSVDTHARRALAQAKKVLATHVLYLRERIDEYSTTTYKNNGSYETEHFERFHNVAIYMVKENAK